jgi:hypothetical protein
MDAEFIIIESIEQPASMEDEVWTDANGDEVNKPKQTHTAKMVALRMIEAC